MASDRGNQDNIGGLRAVWRLFFSKRTPAWAKWLFGLAALAYLVFPVDALPDFLFPLGLLDDALVFPVLMWVATWFASGREEADAKKPSAGERRRKTVKNEAPPKSPPGDDPSPQPDDPPIGERGPGMRRSL